MTDNSRSWMEVLKGNATSSTEIGPGSWATMHLTGLESDEDKTGECHNLFLLLVQVLCKRFKANECRQHFLEHAEKNPVKKGKAFEWSVRAHNAVNKRQGKTELTLEQAYEIWGPDNIRIAPCTGGNDEYHTQSYPNTITYGQQPSYYSNSSVSPMTYFGPLHLMSSMSTYYNATHRK